MLDTFEIHSSIVDYTVSVGTSQVGMSLVESLLDRQSLLIIDEGLASLWPQLSTRQSISVLAEESQKTLHTVDRVIEQMRQCGATRDTRVVAIGGGIVQDIATLSASLYMRGVAWSYVPTTLLGMVDSCLGGKSSLNVGHFKNLAGNFYPPHQIVIDTQFCRTLNRPQIVAGLCEAVKICFADRSDAFERFLAITEDEMPDPAALATIVSLSLRTKKEFIEQDEFDRGMRLLLNFGHTFGHAIEGASQFSISHGVAVGLGMLAAQNFCNELGLLRAGVPRIERLARYLRGVLSFVPHLRRAVVAIDAGDALEKFKSDKKHRPDEYAVIVPDAEGYLERRFLPKSPDVEAALLRSWSQLGAMLDEVQ